MTTALSEVAEAIDSVVESAARPNTREGQRPRFGNLLWLFTAGFALGGYKIGLGRLHDNSFFVHLTTGRWILDHGAVPHVDAYSFTASGEPFVAQSWLASILYGAFDRSPLGGQGIRFTMALVASVIVVATFGLALRCNGDRRRATVIGLLAFVVTGTMYSARPLAFGLLGLVAVVWIVEVPDSALARRVEVSLPVVMWLWGNTHGSMALGFAYIGLHLIGRRLDGAPLLQPGRERRLIVATAIAVVALCVNPYGPKLLVFPIALMARGDALADVVEWMSPNFHSAAGVSFALFLLFAFVVAARGNRPAWRDVVVAVPFVLLGLWALRNLAIATIVLVPIVARACRHDATSPKDDGADAHAGESRAIGLMFTAALALLAVVFTFGALTEPPYDTSIYSTRAFAQLEREGRLGQRVFTTDANAGWVLAKYFPKQRVFMDDRFDMFPLQVMDDYDVVSKVQPGWDDRLVAYRIGVVVWPTNKALSEALRLDRAHWRRIHRDKQWSTFVRTTP